MFRASNGWLRRSFGNDFFLTEDATLGFGDQRDSGGCVPGIFTVQYCIPAAGKVRSVFTGIDRVAGADSTEALFQVLLGQISLFFEEQC